MKQLSANPVIRLARNLDALIEEFKNHCVHISDDYGDVFCRQECEALVRYISVLRSLYRRDFIPCSSSDLRLIESVLSFKPRIFLADVCTKYDCDSEILPF